MFSNLAGSSIVYVHVCALIMFVTFLASNKYYILASNILFYSTDIFTNNQVLRLSAATQDLPRSLICNVHGVNPQFLKVGKSLAEVEDSETRFSKGAYYLGKMIWGKGYRELVDLLAENKNALGNIALDVFGSGEDSEEVQAEAQKHGLAMNFHKGIDHADPSLYG